jgi:hypothetical protein
MRKFSFDQLIERYGEVTAWHFLAEIEKAAGMQPRHAIADPEARLKHAFQVQDSLMAIGQAA